MSSLDKELDLEDFDTDSEEDWFNLQWRPGGWNRQWHEELEEEITLYEDAKNRGEYFYGNLSLMRAYGYVMYVRKAKRQLDKCRGEK